MIGRVCAGIMAAIGPPTIPVRDAGWHIRPCVKLATFASGLLLAAAPAVPGLADPLPRDALPSSEAIEWLLETEPTGAAVPWANSRSGYSGTVTVTQTWYRADGTPCREYAVTATPGEPQMTLTGKTIKGTGCRAATGAWNLSEDAPAPIAVAAFSPPSKKPPEPNAPSPDTPRAAAAEPSPAPAVRQAEAPPPAPTTPAASDASFTTAGFSLPTDEHEPATIRARLPSRSDE